MNFAGFGPTGWMSAILGERKMNKGFLQGGRTMTTQLTMHWVAVLDSHGRSHMEARWAPSRESTLAAQTHPTHHTPHAA